MPRRSLALLLTWSLASSCQSVPSGTRPQSDEVPTLAAEPSGEALHFPPAPVRRERQPLPRAIKAAAPEAETGIVAPELDEDGNFEFSGQTLRIRFNDKIVAKLDGPTPVLTIEPEVAGKIVAPDDYTLRFEAAAPFDPEQTYRVRLGTVHDRAGKRIAEGWNAQFHADPEIWIAGKVISYLPELGAPRIVATLPTGGVEIGRRASFEVLFDQPVTTAQAEALVELVIPGTLLDTKIPIAASHPGRDVFGGVEVDRRHVAVVRPRKALPGGSTVELRRKDPGAPESGDRFSVAGELTFDGVQCWGYGSECSFADGVLEMAGNGFTVTYSNVLAARGKAARKLVRISPPVRNLSVYNDEWGTDGRLSVSGEFAPSTTYRVTIAGVRDKFGGRHGAESFELKTDPLAASVAMAEGALLLDAERAGKFAITTRNVETATLKLWQVDATALAWDEAERKVGSRESPSGDPTLYVPITPTPTRDASVETTVDLAGKLEPGKAYVAQLELGKPAFGAKTPSYPEWSNAGRPPTALVTVVEPDALLVRAHTTPRALLVHVARIGDAHPIEGATFSIQGQDLASITSDKDGFAVLRVGAEIAHASLLEVEHAGHRTQLRLGRGQTEAELAPAYAGEPAVVAPMRAMIVTDRGVYRPGSKVFVKAIVRRVEGDELPAAPSFPVRVRIEDPTGEQVFMERGLTNAAGAIATEFTSERSAKIGRYSVVVEPWFGERTELAREQIQIAEFEPPRFAVDVGATADDKSIRGEISGRYLFGAAMEGARASWTVRRTAASIPGGPFADRGLRFRDDVGHGWWEDEESAAPETWMRVGEGVLDTEGKLAISQAIELPKDGGPQSFVLEAEVSDESHRTIANRAEVTVFDAERYAGVRLVDRWQAPGIAVPLELGVVDREGKAVAGTTVVATLERLDWERTRRPGPGGAEHVQWHPVRKEVARCSAETSTIPVSCELVPPDSGDYVVSAWVDGRRGGAEDVWVWNGRGTPPVQPGHELEIVADASKHAPGQTATLEFPNPFGESIAIVTIEGAGELRTATHRITGTTGSIPVEIRAGDAPRLHATVSLLPVDAKGEAAMQWKFGAIRLPVALDDARLVVAVSSDQPAYEPRDRAEITIEVLRGGQPVANADVVLAVVDEGVLRLTDFHAPDPVEALHPAGGLSMRLLDQRDLLAALAMRSHIAGDGASGGEQSLVATRKNFVQTALWRPDLVTDENGRVHVPLDLPDNLTRFRMMAVVLDEHGRGGMHEQGFDVRKPLMVVPAIPRFAILGDTFEAAALVHNEQDHAVKATVALGDEVRAVEIAAHARARVPFSVVATTAGRARHVFEVRDEAGTVRDRVEVAVPVQTPGIDEHPRLAASFVGAQDVVIEVPQDAFVSEEHPDLVVTTGVAMWPELGARLEFLVDYPHGCVEQTTSSTLPLLAAREILPRLGFTRYSRAQIDDRIAAGVERLASMRTSEGGLAYWPGDSEPNAYGTAYALRAIVRAREAGIPVPSGLVEGMTSYLQTELTSANVQPAALEIRSSIALALAEADALPPSIADALWDGRKVVGPFGQATLAIVLASLPNQDERVGELLDLLEAELDEKGEPKKKAAIDDFHYYGSPARTRAQAALALERLRPSSTLLPVLVDRIVTDTDEYTTQSTAFGLLALSERIRHLDVEDATFTASLDGDPLWADPIETVKLGGGAMRWTIPLADLRGRTVRLRVNGTGERAASMLVEAHWRRPFAATGALQATSAKRGPDVYRLYTDVLGKPIDLASIEPGEMVRVGLLARMPTDTVERTRIGYVAITDRIPAGFEPIQPDLATVANAPELAPDHPLAQMMAWGEAEASHSEVHDDRVDLYFDRVWGEWVAATYLMRATTPGEFVAAPARVELMYEPDSVGFSESENVTVTP